MIHPNGFSSLYSLHQVSLFPWLHDEKLQTKYVKIIWGPIAGQPKSNKQKYFRILLYVTQCSVLLITKPTHKRRTLNVPVPIMPFKRKVRVNRNEYHLKSKSLKFKLRIFGKIFLAIAIEKLKLQKFKALYHWVWRISYRITKINSIF